MSLTAATGTISNVSSHVITLDTTEGFAAGDTVIVESMHGYGEEGLGGSQFDDGYTGYYYLEEPQGLSIIATVLYASRRVLVLDTEVPVGALGSMVYRCNAADLEAAAAADTTLQLPSGNFALSRAVVLTGVDNFTLVGQGVTTKLFSPRGVPCVSIELRSSDGVSISDIAIQGNARDEGYGLLFINDAYVQGDSWPIALEVASCDSCNFARIYYSDVWMGNVLTLSTNCNVTDCTATYTEGLRQYVQWIFMAHFCTNVVFTRCTVSSPRIVPGFADVLSTGTIFSGCQGINAVAESNGGGNFLFQNMAFTFAANVGDESGFANSNWVLNINVNLGDASRVSQGGRIERISIIHTGKNFTAGHCLAGIVTSPSHVDIIVEDITYDAPTDALMIHTVGYAVYGGTADNTTLLNPVSVTQVGAYTPYANVTPED